MNLFKFISDTSVIDFMVQGIVKFTPIRELNDPSEMIPELISFQVEKSRERLRVTGYSKEDMTHLRKQEQLLKRLAPEFQAISAPETPEQASELIDWTFYNNTEYLEELLRATARKMSSKVGLLCLSKRFDSLPMWAHYADNARGVAVEFSDLQEYFIGDKTGILNEPIEIKYEAEKVGVTFDPSSHESIFFSKFQDWSYEEEVRVVRPLDECEERRLDSGQVLYLHQLPRRKVTRIILGWNVSQKAKERIRQKVSSINPEVQVVEAHFGRGRLEIR